MSLPAKTSTKAFFRLPCQSAATHLCPWVERGNAEVACLPKVSLKNTEQKPPPQHSHRPLSPGFNTIFTSLKFLKAEFLTDRLSDFTTAGVIWYSQQVWNFLPVKLCIKTSIYNFLTDVGELHVDELKWWKITWKFGFLTRTWLIWKIREKIKFTRTSNI